MDSSEALDRIALLREHLGRVETARVYHAASVAFTGLMAFVGAAIQETLQIVDPRAFVQLWVLIATLCALVVGVETYIRCRLREPGLMRDATIAAAKQFLPSIFAGGLLTFAIHRSWPAGMHLLPAFWAIAFSLGVFASRVGLPKWINIAGAYYLLVGTLMIDLLPKSGPIPSWAMPISFGAGQMLIALVFHFSAEARHGQE